MMEIVKATIVNFLATKVESVIIERMLDCDGECNASQFFDEAYEVAVAHFEDDDDDYSDILNEDQSAFYDDVYDNTNFVEIEEHVKDSIDYNKDPYKYNGVSREDFV